MKKNDGNGRRPLTHCRLTGKPLREPVIAEDGFTYEKEAINKWLVENDTSPTTHEKMGKNLIPNYDFQELLLRQQTKELKDIIVTNKHVTNEDIELRLQKLEKDEERKWAELDSRENERLQIVVQDNERIERDVQDREILVSLLKKKHNNNFTSRSDLHPPFGLMLGGFVMTLTSTMLWSCLYTEDGIAMYIDLFGPDCIEPLEITFGAITFTGLALVIGGSVLLICRAARCCTDIDNAPNITVSNNALMGTQHAAHQTNTQALQQQ